MSSADSTSPSSTPVRIAPWRGPVQVLMLGLAATLSLFLQVSYLVLIAGVFLWLCWKVYGVVGGHPPADLLRWEVISELAKWAVLGVTWVFMLRPLRSRTKQNGLALQVTAATQPQLYEVLHTLCLHLRADPPVQVWLDTSISVRTSMAGGLAGILTGQTVLHLGLPVISVITSRELGALLTHELSRNVRGVSTIFVHATREMNAWFFHAVLERHQGELNMRLDRPADSALEEAFRWGFRSWMWTAKLPFMAFALAARLGALPALWLVQRHADTCAAQVMDSASCARIWRKLALLHEAWKAAGHEVTRGVTQHRLPENLSLFMARHVAQTAKDRATLRAEAGETESSAASGHGAAPLKGETIVGHLSPVQSAAAVIRQFVDLSRQVTSFYYQHGLGLNLHEHRMAGDAEVSHENRMEEEALLTIRRYFGGLAHPERAMCGLGSTPSSFTSRPELQQEILRVRDEIILWGPQFKVALQEWNHAWQRRRDLEAAATLSLAGFTVSRMQFGTEDASSSTLKAEAARQRMVMEHMEGPLHEREQAIESRFAAALGMLWWSADADLSECLRHRRRDLPGWVSVYEPMSGALPAFRELLTTFFAFQTLNSKFANVDDPSSFLTALQSVVPKMVNLVKQIMSTMDGAPYPFAEGSRRTTLNEHLLPKGLPEMPGVSLLSMDVSSMRSLGVKMAADASACITPYVDAFLALYHSAFAWLAESAERSETHFLGPLTHGSATEILLPDEFTTQRLGMRTRSPEMIAAWKP